MCRPLFAAVLVRLRSIAGRSRRIEHDVAHLLDLTRKLEKMMSDNKSQILAKLEALQAQVTDHTTREGNKLAEAVAAARAAQQTEDKAASDAELADALAKIEEISRGLVEFNPSQN